jgi:methyl-accepting chemotaxis protein
MSVKFKIIGLSILSILLAIFLTTVTAISTFQNTLIESAESNLQTDVKDKALFVHGILKSYKSLALSLSNSDFAKKSLSDFSQTFNALEKDVRVNEDALDQELIAHYDSLYLSKVNYALTTMGRNLTTHYLPKSLNGKIAQKLFILDNPNQVGSKNNMSFNPKYDYISYMKTHEKYHHTYNKILEEFGFYDIFLINKDGNIVYSTYKEKDYATSLRQGIYKLTGLGRAFHRAMDSSEGDILFEDFDYYEPSYNDPASFMASPIVVDGKVEGVIAFQVPQDVIEKTLTDNYHGESDEVYIIGTDYKMRTTSRFVDQIKGDDLVKTTGKTVGVYEIKNNYIKDALMGNSGVSHHKNYLGVESLIAYNSIDVFGGKWAIIGEISEDEAMKDVAFIINLIIAVSIVVTILTVVAMFIFIDRFLTVPLGEIIHTTSGISDEGDGDLTQRLEIHRSDEFGIVGNNINAFIDKIQKLVNTVKDLAERNLLVSKQVNRVSDIISQRISSENKTLTAISESGRSISNNLKDTASKIKESKDLISRSNKVLESAKVEVHELADKVGGASTNQKDLAKKLSVLSDNAEKIKDVLFVIDDIADQTNLLALNAAIEAARAGEHGRGFAVVAFEVTKLADKTQESLADVNKIVTVVLDEIRDAVANMNKSSTTINELSIISSDASRKISESSENIKSSVDIIETTVNVAVDTASQTTDIIEKIQQITKLSNENTKSIDEMLNTANDLNDSGVKLQDELSLYKS